MVVEKRRKARPHAELRRAMARDACRRLFLAYMK